MNQTEINKRINFLNDIYDTMLFYYVVILAPIGIVANALSVVLFSRKNLNKTNMGFYGVSAAVSNIITLFYFIFAQNSTITLNTDLLTVSDISCRLTWFFRRTIRQITPAIESLVSFDRFFEVFFPRRFPIMRNKKFLMALICVIYFILSGLNFTNLLYYLNVSYSSNKTTTSCTAARWVSVSSDIVANSLRIYIPLILMVSLNTMIVVKLVKSKSMLKNRDQSKENEFTRTVTSISSIFFLLNFPAGVSYIVRIVYKEIYELPSNNLTMGEINFAFNILVNLTATLYYMIHFFIHLRFNKIFRSEFLILFRLRRNAVKVETVTKTVKTAKTEYSSAQN